MKKNYIEIIKNNMNDPEVSRWLTRSGRWKKWANHIDEMPLQVAKTFCRTVGLLQTPEEKAFLKCREIIDTIKTLRHLDATWGDSMSPESVAEACDGTEYVYDAEIEELKQEFDALYPLAKQWMPLF